MRPKCPAALTPAPAMARVQEHVVAVTDGEVPVRVLVPLDSPAGVIVYYHGGGWVIGTIAVILSANVAG